MSIPNIRPDSQACQQSSASGKPTNQLRAADLIGALPRSLKLGFVIEFSTRVPVCQTLRESRPSTLLQANFLITSLVSVVFVVTIFSNSRTPPYPHEARPQDSRGSETPGPRLSEEAQLVLSSSEQATNEPVTQA